MSLKTRVFGELLKVIRVSAKKMIINWWNGG